MGEWGGVRRKEDGKGRVEQAVKRTGKTMVSRKGRTEKERRRHTGQGRVGLEQRNEKRKKGKTAV